jgi:general secretion pathway protein A
MYEKFFGFTDLPFRLLPDTRFFFESREHAKALAYLQYGLHKGEGFVVLTGEVGTGKTLLADSLVEQIGATQGVSSVAMPQLEPEDLLRAIGKGFGLGVAHLERSAFLTGLVEAIMELGSNGRPPLVLIDEAQNLPLASLEVLRMMSNLRHGRNALLQVCLIGQPSLRSLLARPELEQLVQRVVAMCHLHPLGLAETGKYIRHRLSTVGWHGDPKIEEEVVTLIHRESRGIARRMNTLMDRLLLLAYLEERHVLDRALAEEMVLDLREEGLGLAPPAALREVDR